MNTTVEFATLSVPFRVKSLDEAKGEFSGYLATWDLDLQLDRIQRGAFAKSLAEARADQQRREGIFLYVLLWMHNVHEPIGGLYEAEEDSVGLRVKGLVDLDTELGRRAFSAMKKGYLRAMSIGYRVHKSKMLPGGVRLIEELELLEGSLVSFPANPQARIADVKTLGAGTEVWMIKLVEDMRRTAWRLGAQRERNKMNRRIDNPLVDATGASYRIEPGADPMEDPKEFQKELRAQLRAEDDIYLLHGKAYDREVERRQQERVQKQLAQKAALEAERREIAERQAAMNAETFTPESFAAASGLDAAFVRNWFAHHVNSGRISPVDADKLILRAQDVRGMAKRDHEMIEVQAIRARNKRLEREVA